MQLNPPDRECLEALYKHHAVATDQLKRRPGVLAQITAAFRRSTGRDEDGNELLRYMINRRKAKDWPRLGKRAKKLPVPSSSLEEGNVAVLAEAYEEIGIPLDEYLLTGHLPRRLADRFASLTGRTSARAADLVGALLAHRKRGLLVCLEEEKKPKRDEPFSDIAEVVQMTRLKQA